jgi:hypothetical protein
MFVVAPNMKALFQSDQAVQNGIRTLRLMMPRSASISQCA